MFVIVPGDEPGVSEHVVCFLQSWYVVLQLYSVFYCTNIGLYLDKVDHIFFFSGATHCELCQPDLLAVPVIQILQLVHHMISISIVVVSSEVVNPATQLFTRLQCSLVSDCQQRQNLPERMDQTSSCFHLQELD